MMRRWLPAVVIGVLVWGSQTGLLWAGFPALADADAILAAAADVDLERYPDADGVTLFSAERVRYEPDGTYVSHAERWVKILTEKGRRDFSAFAFHFNDHYGEATVERAEIYRPGDAVRAIDVEAQSRIMISPDQMHMNIYDPRQKVLRLGIPGLEIGDMVRVQSLRKQIRTRMPETFSDYTVLEAPIPLLHAVYEVEAPAELPLVHRVIKSPIGNPVEIEERAGEDGRVVYRWTARDVPRLFEEPNMPDWWTVSQRLLVSTIPDWETVSRWYWELSRPRLESTTPEMEEKVQALTAGIADRQERLEAIFRFVSQQVRYMGITTEEVAPGYEPRDVHVTFEHRYGVCRDKAALLVAMLRLDGFDAFPVLMHVGPRKDEEVPQPFFNHAIVAVREPDGSFQLMEMTDETTRELFPAYLGDKSYLVATPEGETLRTSTVTPANENMVWIETEADLDASGQLTARTSIRFAGMNDNLYRGHFAGRKPSERRRFFEGLIKQVVPSAQLSRFDLFPEDMQDAGAAVEAIIEWSASDLPVRSEDRMLLPPPWFGERVGMVNFILREAGLHERRFPFRTNYACGVAERFVIRLAPGPLAIRDLPQEAHIDLGSLEWRRSWDQDGRDVSGFSFFHVHAPEFSPEAYQDVRHALGEIRLGRQAWPVLELVPEAAVQEADAHVAHRETRIEVASDSAWTATHQVSKTVLTYAGIKDHSEILVPFNPEWEDVELLEARVTAPDGVISVVRDAEVNVMDEPWVASAPRYPPGKILVANLPGVRAGSRIDYALRRRVFNRPFFSYRKAFGGTEPADRMALTVALPAGVELDRTVLEDDGRLSASRPMQDEDGRVVYRWTHAQPGTGSKEDHLPPGWALYPTVFLSRGDWIGYAKDVGQRLEALAATGERVARFARAHTVGEERPLERIRLIRDAVTRRIRPAGPSFADLPLDALTPPDVTFEDGYGHDADRAIVLVAMLRAVGFEAEFVLGSRWAAEDPVTGPLSDTPQRDLFSTVLVAVEVEGVRTWLNDTDQYAEPGATSSEGRIGLSVPAGRLETIRAAPDHASVRVSEYALRVTREGGARIGVIRRFEGTAHAEARRHFEEMTPEERRRYHQEAVSSLSHLAEQVGELEIDFGRYPGEVRFTADIGRFTARAGESHVIHLPGARPVLPFRADRRSQALWWTARDDERTVHRVFLPADVRVLHSPTARQWTAPGGIVSVSRTVRLGADETAPAVVIEEDIRQRPGLVGALVYPALVKARGVLDHAAERIVVFAE